METTPTARREKRRRRRLLAFLMVAAAITSAGSATLSLALFTDSATVAANFTAGTIVIGVTPDPIFNVTPTGDGPIMPGDTKTAVLTVANQGTAELRYNVTTTHTDTPVDFATLLTTTVAPTATDCAGAGAAIYTGDLAGIHWGPEVLAAGASQRYCLTVSLDIDTGNTYQGATATATLTFAAEQTAHNP